MSKQQAGRAGMRLTAIVLTLFVATVPALPASAGQFPPQLPSQEDMDRLHVRLESTLKQVRSAQARLDEVVRAYEEAERQLHVEEAQLEALKGPIAENQAKQDQLAQDLIQAKARINKRAASAYRLEGVNMINVLLAARTFRDFLTRLGLIKSVTAADSRAFSQVRTYKQDAEKLRAQLEAQKAAEERQVAEVAKQQGEIEKQQSQVRTSLAGLGNQFDAVRAEINKAKSGFAFPVAAPYSYVDSFGAPRMEGSAFYHRHEGTDIFAPHGTPLLAVVDGVIEHVGEARLGGTKLWLRSPGDNWTYYYAHLAGYAPGIAEGTRVAKGDVIGYVGNTGNARTTPPHLHFEIHHPAAEGAPEPFPRGPAANPFPILRRVDPLAKR